MSADRDRDWRCGCRRGGGEGAVVRYATTCGGAEVLDDERDAALVGHGWWLCGENSWWHLETSRGGQ